MKLNWKQFASQMFDEYTASGVSIGWFTPPTVTNELKGYRAAVEWKGRLGSPKPIRRYLWDNRTDLTTGLALFYDQDEDKTHLALIEV